jgi:hypothetical protein
MADPNEKEDATVWNGFALMEGFSEQDNELAVS